MIVLIQKIVIINIKISIVKMSKMILFYFKFTTHNVKI
jgi:hypothetical protein